MALSPVIDDHEFKNADQGLKAPLRRQSLGAARLAITNLDHKDPPPPYQGGGVPREKDFNANVLSIDDAPKMPEIEVALDVQGFDPAATPILWRLETLYVVGRFQKVSGGQSPHYRSRVLSLGDRWTGEARDKGFTIFDTDPKVAYDNRSDRVAGGHCILTVAARPPGASDWLQDYVHLRIGGTNPTEKGVRDLVNQLFTNRTPEFVHMTNAVFVHENAMTQFDPRYRTGERYAGVQFNWPHDPANFPAIAFDYGIGIGQYTHPGNETIGICWDWRENVTAGINELLDNLRSTFKAGIAWTEWARRAWSTYNAGSPTSPAGLQYAAKLAALPDGQLISTGSVPKAFDKVAQTDAFPLMGAPPNGRPWPVTAKAIAVANPTLGAQDALVAAVVGAIGTKGLDQDALSWMWPKVESEIIAHSDPDNSPTFPGLASAKLHAVLAVLDEPERKDALDAAFSQLLAKATVPPKAAPAAAAALLSAPAFASAGVAGEWSRLSAIVRDNVEGGISGWSNVRRRMFEAFKAPDDPDTAIPRINAYYATLVGANFPPMNTPAIDRNTPVHPKMQQRLASAVALLQAKNQDGVLSVLRDIGGFSIRSNVNSPDKLSNHSFGWALDLDPELNPNTAKKNLPLDLLNGFTGVELYGELDKRLRTARPYDACLPDVEVFTKASDAFKSAYQNATTLKAAIGQFVSRTHGQLLTATQLDHVFNEANAEPAQTAEVRQTLIVAGLNSARAKAAATFIVSAVGLLKWRQTVTKPAVTGSPKTIAAFGFVNLPAPLIAALTASDGGRLVWLGAALATKDMMHFELPTADNPPLV